MKVVYERQDVKESEEVRFRELFSNKVRNILGEKRFRTVSEDKINLYMDYRELWVNEGKNVNTIITYNSRIFSNKEEYPYGKEGYRNVSVSISDIHDSNIKKRLDTLVLENLWATFFPKY